MCFYWLDDLESFFKWLFYSPDRRTENGKLVRRYAIAHNAKKFDSYLLLDWLLRRNKTPKVNLRGRQVMQLIENNVYIKDFACFVPMRLAQIPKAFGFAGSKGYFPHRYAHPDVFDKILPCYPESKYYDIEKSAKTQKEIDDFYQWYDDSCLQRFDFKAEAIKYCMMDCEILLEAIKIFEKLTFDEVSGGTCKPLFSSPISLAGFSALLYRQTSMPSESSIGIVPAGGYCPQYKQSDFALYWLDWLNHVECEEHGREPVAIRHLGHGCEKLVDGLRVDGWEAEKKTAYGIHGCFYHG